MQFMNGYLAVTVALVMAVGVVTMATSGCGPDKPEIATTVQQVFTGTQASLLANVKWEDVATALQGRVGPDFMIEAEAYFKTSAGIIIRGHGGEITISTQGHGEGGGDNSATFPEILQIMQRWERADDATRADKAKWTQDFIDALLKADARKKAATSQPAASQPAAVTESPVESQT